MSFQAIENDFRQGRRTADARLELVMNELDKFFQGKDAVHRTMRRLTEKLEKARIPYAIVGGMAVAAHHHLRATKDVDVLLSKSSFDEFVRRFVGKSYDAVPGRPKRFFDRRFKVMFDILVAGLFPGSGKPGPFAYPDPAGVRQVINNISYVNLHTLVQLKLAARRYQDFADVVNVIRANELDESFQAKLHPSVHRDFIECLEECRREEEYERRQDEQMGE